MLQKKLDGIRKWIANLEKEDHIQFYMLSAANLLMFVKPFWIYLILSDALKVIYASTSFACTVINLSAIREKKVNVILGTLFFIISVICLIFAMLAIIFYFNRRIIVFNFN